MGITEAGRCRKNYRERYYGVKVSMSGDEATVERPDKISEALDWRYSRIIRECLNKALDGIEERARKAEARRKRSVGQ